MATTSRPNPIPNEQVIIDVVYGYPVDPQPLPSAATDANRKASEFKVNCYLAIALFLILIVLGVVTEVLESRKKLPRFQLDSVSFDGAENTSTAVWEIGFSIDKPVGDLGVWVRFMGRDYKVESVGTAGNTTVSVSTLMPRGFDYSGGLIRLEQVTLRCNNYKHYLLEAACKDVAVDLGFLSNETSTLARGVMEGGPRLCPVVNHKHI